MVDLAIELDLERAIGRLRALPGELKGPVAPPYARSGDADCGAGQHSVGEMHDAVGRAPRAVGRHLALVGADRVEVDVAEPRVVAVVVPEPEAVVDPRLSVATGAALAALSGEERSILAYYFLDDLTLARIAAILRVHESTISRRLEKLVTGLRKDIVLRLTRAGLSRRQAEEALEVDVRDLTVDIRGHLTQDSPSAAFSKEEKIVKAGEAQD